MYRDLHDNFVFETVRALKRVCICLLFYRSDGAGGEAALKFMHAAMHSFNRAFVGRGKQNETDFVIENIPVVL